MKYMPSKWNDYVKAHAGCGKTLKQLSAQYRASCPGMLAAPKPKLKVAIKKKAGAGFKSDVEEAIPGLMKIYKLLNKKK